MGEEAAAPSSSPSHDFSFAISLHPSFNLASDCRCGEIDMAPADDIFFHGHLLPLQPLSIPTISPRPSSDVISIKNRTHPLEHTASDRSLRYRADDRRNEDDDDDDVGRPRAKERSKPKSFSSLFGVGKWRKENDMGERDEEDKRKRKKKGIFDVSRLLKKYARIVEPLLFFKGEKEKGSFRQRPYSFSFSGHPNPRERDEWRRRRRGEFSAPASMRTSPTSSGLLSATSVTLSSSNESTMEELQSAIEEAITHCKKSIADNKVEC